MITVDDLKRFRMRTTVYLDGDGPMKHARYMQCVERPELMKYWVQNSEGRHATRYYVGGKEIAMLADYENKDDELLQRLADAMNEYEANKEPPK